MTEHMTEHHSSANALKSMSAERHRWARYLLFQVPFLGNRRGHRALRAPIGDIVRLRPTSPH
jgi:hypothetical protein